MSPGAGSAGLVAWLLLDAAQRQVDPIKLCVDHDLDRAVVRDTLDEIVP